jgi:hypothetical protein
MPVPRKSSNDDQDAESNTDSRPAGKAEVCERAVEHLPNDVNDASKDQAAN